MHKKNFGVSLIELLVTMTISVILAGIAIPSMTNWYKKDQFLSQAEEIADAIYTVRANSLSEKKCPNGTPSEYWTFSLTNSSFSISCNDDSSTTKETLFNNHIQLIKTESLITLPLWTDIPVNESFNAYIKMFSGENQSQIYFVSPSFSIKKIKLSFVFEDDNTTKRTICFNRIAGFSTTSLTDACDD